MEFSSKRADSIAPAETITSFARAVCASTLSSLLNEIRDAVDDAAFVRLNSLRYRFGYEFTVAGCQSPRNHRVV